MKTALMSFLLSFSAFASDCYVRTVEVESTDVTLSKEICIEDIKLDLQMFGKKTALISYTLDGVAKEKEVNLSIPIERRDGKILFLVYGLENNYTGGWCGDLTEANIDADLVMNRDGSGVVLEDIKGRISFTNDNCHMDSRDIQKIPYVKVQE